MEQYEKSNRVMESENHFKNGVRMKSQRLALNLKSLLTTVILLCLCTFMNRTMAQTWQIGSQNAASVTATLSSGTLTISGTGAMQNFGGNSSTPWYSVRGNINSLVIQNGVTSISTQAFNNCSNLKTVTIQDGTVALIFAGYNNSGHFLNSPIETLYLGRDLDNTYFNDGSPFMENSALKTVTIGNDVTTINDNSFYNCTGLQSLTMGSALISIGNNAFYGCSSLAGTLTIPNKVKTVGSSAFQGCRTLPSITIPNSVTSIGSQAFNDCSNLKNVTIEDGTVALIFAGYNNSGHFLNSPIETLNLGRDLDNTYYNDGSPFMENTVLKSVTIGNNVTVINANSFKNCTGLTNITIPHSVTSIGSSAFAGCRLTEIHSQNPTPPNAADGCFYNVYATCKLYVPTAAAVDLYKAAPEWKKFFEISPTGITDVISNQLKIYPNPVNNELIIEKENVNKGNEKVQIIDLSGRVVITSQFLPFGAQLKINVSYLSAGTYIVKTGSYMSKFVKK